MTNTWFIIHGGKETGPYSPADLKQMVVAGKLQADDKVRRADMKTPTSARNLKGLFPIPTPPQPSAPASRSDPPPTAILILDTLPPSAPTAPQAVPVLATASTEASQTTPHSEAHPLSSVPVVGTPNSNLFARFLRWFQTLTRRQEVGVCVAGCFILMLLCSGILGKALRNGFNSSLVRMAGGVTIKHDRYTQVIMPELPPERVHDKEEGELERDIGEVPVPDISKVDFLHGPNGEPVEMVKYFAVNKLEGGPETKVLRYYGHLYRNKAGKNVYHGPWCNLYDGDKNKKESETVYVHGAMKFTSRWEKNGKPLSLEIFKSDDEHTQVVNEYYESGKDRFRGQFVKVRHVPRENKSGHWVERTPDGMHVHYWEQTGGVRQEEIYENGQQVGIAIYDLRGKKVLGQGRLRS